MAGFYSDSPVQDQIDADELSATEAKTAAEAAQAAAEAAQAAAETAEAGAEASELAAGSSETNAAQSATSAANSATSAATQAASASSSASSAASSDSSAAASASNAAASATAAATSASTASGHETTASTKASEASASASNAAASETAAGASELAAASSESAAASSATAAASSATTAATEAGNAATSATAAAASETNAASSATAAAASETAAAASETAAAASESAAAASETAAGTSETNAAGSASAAASSATAAASSATAAGSSESAAAGSATAAASSATDAATSASNAATSESNAATSETNAATSASNAATSETNAATSATNAATSESNAAGSATSAASSASAAGSARDAALAALDSFDDRYLGQKTSDPSLDNDGNALISGALYFDSTNSIMKVYDGSQWLAAYASTSGSLLAANNLSDLANAATARTNLGLGTAATTAATAYATAAQGALADSATQPGDNVSTLANDAGYLTSFTETDPVFSASAAAGITSTNITNWNTAYGWGDHASAGYLTGNQTITLSGDASGSGTTSIVVTVADDSHNHIISNVDGLQTALNAKQDASTALTTSTSFGGDVSGTYNAIVVANDSHTHAFDNLTGKTSGTGDYSTDGDLVSGRGSGGVALTVNDGYGNANVTWNHQDGTPEQTGNAARIEVNTDSSTGASMYFELKSGVTGGVATGLTNIMKLTESAITAESGISFTGSGSGLTGTASSLSIGGNAATASSWATARTLSLTGAVTGSASIDGSGNVSLATTATSDPTLTLAGDASGSATFTNLGNATLTVTVANDSHTHAFNNLTSKTGGTGTYYTNGTMAGATLQGGTNTALTGVGQVGLFANDPYISFHPGSSVSRNGYLQKVNTGDYFLFGEETYVRSDTSFRAPLFYDQNNTSYYVDAAGTSVFNEVLISSDVRLRDATGDYGSLEVANGGTGGYEGYSIGGRVVFMHNGASVAGLYDDVNNQWFIRSALGAESIFYYNGAAQAYTQNGYFLANNQMRSPVFYDSNNTAYYIDGNNGSVLSQLRLDSTSSAQLYTLNDYLNITYGAGGAGGIALYDGGGVIQGYWYGSGGGEHGFLDNDGSWAVRIRTGTSPNIFYCNGNPELYVYTSYVRAIGSFRAPVFFDNDNTAYYFDGSATSDSIRVAGDIVAYYSDERLKTNLGNIESPVDKVKQLNGFKYHANELGAKHGYDPEKIQVGVSAQEVEAVLPEVVRDAPIGHGYKTVQYERLVPLLIEAIKEQAGQIEALQAEVAKLKG